MSATRMVHGRCAVGRKCKDAGVIFRWVKGTVGLKDARCPSCGLPLKQTAPSLSFAEVRDVPPPFGILRAKVAGAPEPAWAALGERCPNGHRIGEDTVTCPTCAADCSYP